MPRSHTRSLDLPIPPDAAFALLHTPSAIRGWWSASRAIVLPKPGGLWVATWGDSEDDPDYVSAATLDIFDPPRRLRMSNFQYLARGGAPPFSMEQISTEFVVEPLPNGSRLAVTQSGFPDDPAADAFYAACEKGWHDTFERIRRYVEHGNAKRPGP